MRDEERNQIQSAAAHEAADTEAAGVGREPEAGEEPGVSSAEPEAAPEPVTPERVAAENRRNDLFLAAGAILVSFLLASFQIQDPSVWLHLKSGWLVSGQGIPRQDPLAYSSQGRSWTNLHWLFDLGLYRAELAETRLRARRLADRAEQFVQQRSRPAVSVLGEEQAPALPAEHRKTLQQAIAALRRAAGTGDSHSIRAAAAELRQTAGPILAKLAARMNSYDQSRRLREEAKQAGLILEPDDTAGLLLLNLAPAVAVKAILIAVMAVILLLFRRAGASLWWSAGVTAWTVLAMSSRFDVGPEVVSFVFLALTLWVLHEVEAGRRWCMWLLPPLTLLWVNFDTLFVLVPLLTLLFVCCQAAAGRFLSGSSGAARRLSGRELGTLAAVAGLCLLASLANPFGWRAWSVPWRWSVALLTHPGAYADLNAGLQSLLSRSYWVWVGRSDRIGGIVAGVLHNAPLTATLLLVLAAAVSFVLNSKRLDLFRAALLVLFVAFCCVAVRHLALAALAAGLALMLNGREWFLDRFGTETRISRGWLLWSQGGRAFTVLLLAALAVGVILGRVGPRVRRRFAYGIEWVRFDPRFVDFLQAAPLTGRMLNLTVPQGDLAVWALDRPGQVYMDSRLLLHSEDLDEYQMLRRALRDGQRDRWGPVLDRERVSCVVLNLSQWAGRYLFRRTFARLNADGDNWRLVHLDAASAVFGRVGLPDDHPLASDARWFAEHAIDPAKLVFKQKGPRLPEPPAPVSPPTLIDRLWGTRMTPTRDTILAEHWLDPGLMPVRRGPLGLPLAPPENCFLAIRSARRGLASTRVSPLGYLALARAYFYLTNNEVLQLVNAEGQAAPRIEQVNQLRVIQLLTALNQLVTAQPDHAEGHYRLSQIYYQQGHFDLAGRHLKAAGRLLPAGEQRERLLADAERLQIRVNQIRQELTKMAAQSVMPQQQIDFLLSRGCTGLAIEQLSSYVALSPAAVALRPTLTRLYISTGQVGDELGHDGAETHVHNLRSSMPGLQPGAWEQMRATVSLMEGDYDSARMSFEGAIAKTRHSMTRQGLTAVSGGVMEPPGLLQGSLLPLLVASVEVAGAADRQARLEFYLAQVHLEAGEPDEAARHFQQSLAIRPDAPYRPIIGYYLERITGKKLPPLPEAKPGAKPKQPPAKKGLPPTKPGPSKKPVSAKPDDAERAKPPSKANATKEPAAKPADGDATAAESLPVQRRGPALAAAKATGGRQPVGSASPDTAPQTRLPTSEASSQ